MTQTPASSPAPDAALVRDFLSRIRSSGFHVLVAIDPDGPGIEARTFAARELDEAVAWAVGWNERGRNCYWTVNSVSRPLASKPSRADVESMDWLHVDVDPDRTRPLEEERARIAGLFEERGLPPRIPQPTLVIDSGGGRQGFWRLTEPLPIGGSPDRYEDAKRYNQQLEIVFRGDHCHNVDRIMRLPGTVNWPDAKKRESGREPRLARVVAWSGAAFRLSEFTPAPKVQGPGGALAEALPEVDTGNVRRLTSLDELPAGLSGLARVVIAQGRDPDHPDRWESRSEALWFACCQLVKAGVDDQTIFAIITDPGWGISESVLRLKGGAPRPRSDRYALHQIARARETEESPDLAELNARHAVIGDLGGRCKILSEGHDDSLDRSVLSYQGFDDFVNRYANRKVSWREKNRKGDEVEVSVPLGKWWIAHPKRRSYERVVFSPGREPEGAYNLWRGFACEALPGDCSLYMRHLRDNVCRGSEELNEYLLSWMAAAVQRPDQPAQTAIVLRGVRGTGKGKTVEWFGRLFGRHFMQVTNPVQLVGQFNHHLRDCVVLFADEAFFAGDKRHEAVLKSLVTESHIITEAKYQAAEMARNCLHLVLASNSDWVVPAGAHERRFLVLDVGEGNRQDRAFFGAIDAQMAAGGLEALLHELLRRDLTGWDPRAVPRTRALQEQKEHSLGTEEEWWYAKLRSGEVREGRGWPEWVVCSELLGDFATHMQSWGRGQRSSMIRLTRLLERAGVQRRQLGRRIQVASESGESRWVDRPRVYLIPPLEEARAAWARLMGGEFDWGVLETLDDRETEEPYA